MRDSLVELSATEIPEEVGDDGISPDALPGLCVPAEGGEQEWYQSFARRRLIRARKRQARLRRWIIEASGSVSGRRVTAAPPVSGAPSGTPVAPPTRRIAVQVYEQPASVVVPTVRAKAARSRGRRSNSAISRVSAGIAVVALHVAIGGWLWTNTLSRSQALAAPVEPLILLPPMPAAAPARVPITSLEKPTMDLPKIAPPHIAMPNMPVLAEPTEVALTLSLAADVLITDASAADVEHILAGCGLARSPEHQSASNEVTLLVRVEKNGRVSDSRVEAGGGTQRVEAAQRCLMSQGVLTPRQRNGETVLSWQRVHLTAASSGRS